MNGKKKDKKPDPPSPSPSPKAPAAQNGSARKTPSQPAPQDSSKKKAAAAPAPTLPPAAAKPEILPSILPKPLLPTTDSKKTNAEADSRILPDADARRMPEVDYRKRTDSFGADDRLHGGYARDEDKAYLQEVISLLLLIVFTFVRESVRVRAYDQRGCVCADAADAGH